MSQNNSDKAYVRQMKTWFKSQENSIKSCEVVIANLKRTIAVNKRQLVLEAEDKKLKKQLLAEAKRDLKNYQKGKYVTN